MDILQRNQQLQLAYDLIPTGFGLIAHGTQPNQCEERKALS